MSQPPPVVTISNRENQAWCVVYGLESAAIIIGNVIIIAAFAITKSLHKKTYLLLISLAVADLLVGAVPLPMFIHVIGGSVPSEWWTLDDHVTHTQTAIEIFCSYASIFFLVAIALERLYASLSPFNHDNLRPWVYYIVIASVWVLALLLGILSFLREEHVGAAKNEGVFIFIMIMLALSMLTVVVSYAIIALILLRSRDKSDDFEKRMAVTLLILSVIFFVTWLPFKVINYIFHFDGTATLSCAENDFACLYHAIYATKFLHYFNSVVNPIVYALRVKDFRKGVRRIFCGCCETQPLHNPPLGQEKGIDNMVSMQSIDTVVPSMFL